MHSAVSLPGKGKENYRETINEGLAAPPPSKKKNSKPKNRANFEH
jgi:hypothetical protein